MGARRILATVALATLLAACGGGGRSTSESSGLPATASATPSSTTTTITGPPTSWVAAAKPGLTTVPVYGLPYALGEPMHVLDQPNADGAPLVFLVKGVYDAQRPAATIPVYLPVRPNGSTGWVRADDVTVSANPFRVKVELDAHEVTVTQSGTIVVKAPVAIGTSDTPTPGGIFYITELLKVPTRNSVYGPYAYGLSGFSDVLATFNGGPGVIGLHGTNDPSTLGTDVSHGCIRMSNEDITRLAALLPLGTPVEIVS